VTRRRIIFILFGLCMLLSITACGSFGTFGPTEPQATAPVIPVDSYFKELYQTLGGEAVLGCALTDLIEREGRKCQYVEAGLMCSNPQDATNKHRYQLEPLGAALQVRDDLQYPMPTPAGSRDLGGGFFLFGEFTTLYDRIYGEVYAGRPLTQVRVNHDLNRYEQYFENVGFYRNLNDPVGQVHLIPYGAYLCGPDCSKKLDEYWLIQRSAQINQPFELSMAVSKWNNFGHPLTQPRLAGDGSVEQVYENGLLYARLDDLANVHLRPLVLLTGFVPVQPLVEKNPHKQLVFYEVENGLGHNVPLFFDQFIAAQGGRDLAGNPITELFPIEDGRIYRQCFENYCLDYDQSAEESARVRMVPLGAVSVDKSQVVRRQFTADTLEIRLEEELPQVGRGEQQRLFIQVLERGSGQPVAFVPGVVHLNLPDKPARSVVFLPTNQDGRSEVVLAPMDGLPNMSVVEYQVCLTLPDDPVICAVDSFIYRGE
jgi:hypothetical protein